MVGKTVSHYKILEKLDSGGMGVVYKAEDTRLGRHVALKFLPEKYFGDPAALKRFEREARSASALNHPHICTIHDIGTHEGQPFIVMECLDGATLRNRMRDRPLETDEAVKLAFQVTDALKTAHLEGIIHRDIKPANIFITLRGDAKILDFGLAKRSDPTSDIETHDSTATTTLTDGHMNPGTLPYMSPEQVAGKPIDTRSDIFSLGLVLYEMLTGVHPFMKDSSIETASAILSDTPPPLSRYKAGIPELLEHTVGKMLAKKPESRYQMIHEVQTNLNNVSAGHSSATQTVDPHRRTAPTLGLYGLLLTIALIVTLIAVLGLDLGNWRDRLLGTASSGPIQSLAVLPLTNFSGDPGQEYFTDGMTDILIANLSKIGVLHVISRTSAMLRR